MMVQNRANGSREYSVELVLDNSKQRVPVPGVELTVKRTYNCDMDKDHFLLNGNHIAEKDLFNLFESGGFSLSCSSQSQIVQQGQVERLTNQGEEGFLRMLSEVTGTEVFDQRVGKMKGVLGECNTKKEQMEKILADIEKRLTELGSDIEEYREIQKLEREKKALERVLHGMRKAQNDEELRALRDQKSKMMTAREGLIN